MKKPVPDVGPLCGLYDRHLPRGRFLFSRYPWVSQTVAGLLGKDVLPLWLHERWQGAGAAEDPINWKPFRRRSMAVLAHFGEGEVEFAARVANRAAEAGVYVLIRPPFSGDLYHAIEQVNRSEFRREFLKNLDIWEVWLTPERQHQYLVNAA
jgi:hypothetical protein